MQLESGVNANPSTLKELNLYLKQYKLFIYQKKTI